MKGGESSADKSACGAFAEMLQGNRKSYIKNKEENMTEKNEKAFLGITIDVEAKEKLVTLAKENRRSTSSQASLMLEEALKKEEKKDEE